MSQPIQIVECPRDAMQGIKAFIPTPLKIAYINQLLKLGFHTIDFGSFVSPKAVPQMADTKEVLIGLDIAQSSSELLAIIANLRGAQDACQYPQIKYLGYPFSISETFQLRNTRKSIAESLVLVEQIQKLCQDTRKELVIYISMAFGNPYGDDWNLEIVEKWVAKMNLLNIQIISLADTVGVASPEDIKDLFFNLIPQFPSITFGAHFHAHPTQRKEKIKAAYEAGCRRFDVALNGFGGCPFAKDELVGNIATESLLAYFKEQGFPRNIEQEAWEQAKTLAQQVFSYV